jgi:hypothetical protein
MLTTMYRTRRSLLSLDGTGVVRRQIRRAVLSKGVHGMKQARYAGQRKEIVMGKEKTVDKERRVAGMCRRLFCEAVVGILLVVSLGGLASFASAGNAPPEPEYLDVPTPWQEGDPKPVKMKVPAVEPEQTSMKAPPCQPMDDVRPEQPSTDHVWVTGYWWWSNQTYLWVPGYWATPPHAGYVYVSGHWTYKDTQWVYVRGGWAKPSTTAIVVYPVPRPVLTAFVITAPIRIACRHYSWGYYPARGVVRRVDRRIDRRVIRRNERRSHR